MPFGTFPDSGATFRNLLGRISAITYVRLPHDPNRAIHLSPSLETVLGLTPEACAADPGVWTTRVHPDDRDRVLEEFEGAHATLQPFSTEYRVRDGQGLGGKRRSRLGRDVRACDCPGDSRFLILDS
jgi:PAS domain-containing protein